MRPPLTYYGGKQKLAKKINSIIPIHNLYCEPFMGGGAVFFTKEKSAVEVINDTNGELMNFYKVAQSDFVALEKEIQISLHSRDLHRKAQVVNANADMFSPIKRAWAIWVLAHQSFSSQLDGTWGYDIARNNTSKKISNKRESFSLDLAIRLQEVQIESTDALRIIKSRDREESFFYCDPPYYNSDCGHYDGYSLEDFENLLKVLSEVKGQFLLSSYPSEVLKEYTKKMGWKTWSIEQTVSVNNASGKPGKKKVEVLTANFVI
jgi:DNA adenine methylase